MAILDDSAAEKAKLLRQIESLRGRLESATERDERDALQVQIQRLELTWKVRWPSDTWQITPYTSMIDNDDGIAKADADRYRQSFGTKPSSLRHHGPRRATPKSKPFGENELDQSAAWTAMADGKASLQRARVSTQNQATGLYQDALHRFAFAGKAFERYDIKRGIAEAHAYMGVTHKECADLIMVEDREKELERAVSHLSAAIENYSEVDNPGPWADAHIALGDAMLQQSDPAQAKNAVAIFQAVLRGCKPETNHEVWSNAVGGLGIAVAKAVDTGALPIVWVSESVNACRTALKELEDKIPHFRAYVSSTLSRMLVAELAVKNSQKADAFDASAQLDEAMACIAEALETFTEEEHPREWAEVQVSKATALMHKGLLAAPDAVPVLCAAAVDAGTAALRIIDADDPNRWATVQLVLMRLHRMLASSATCADAGRELDQAIECIDVVLPVLGPNVAEMKTHLEKQRADIVSQRSDI